MNSLLIFGAGGHAKVVLEAVNMNNQFERVTLVDRCDEKKTWFGNEVLCENKCKIEDLLSEFTHAFIAIGKNRFRLERMRELRAIGFRIPTIVHPQAMVSPSAKIKEGVFVNAGAVINADSEIGSGAIINTGAIIDHDCVVSDGVHVSPGAVLGGSVFVGETAWICLGAKVINNISIGRHSIVAAGSVVVRDVDENVMVAGVPAVKKKMLTY